MSELIIILECENKKIFIDTVKKNKLISRLRSHRDGKKHKWTKKYKAKKLLYSYPKKYENQLQYATESWMIKCGIDNVRGGPYQTFKLTKEQKKKLKRKQTWEKGCCFRCGRTSHWIGSCKEKTYVNGEAFTDDEGEDYDSDYSNSSSICCENCGHLSSSKNAAESHQRTHLKRKRWQYS